MRRKLAATLAVAGLLAAMTAPAAIAKPLHQCNSGGGNGSEGLQFHDCDPGNSGANNNAGD